MSTWRLISVVWRKLPGLWPGSMTTTLPLRGPEAAGREVEEPEGEGDGLAGLAYLSASSVPGVVREDGLSGAGVFGDCATDPFEPPPPSGSPTVCHTSQPTNAPGTSAATATVRGLAGSGAAGGEDRSQGLCTTRLPP